VTHSVHIVVPDINMDWVIARLARYLRDKNNWTAGSDPTAGVDVNVFMPYLMWNRSHWTQTPSIAWFTHRETMTPAKAAAWDEAARGVTIRTSQSQLYMPGLAESGLSMWVPSPVELKKFTPVELASYGRPRIGVAGYTYASARKGEANLARLHREHAQEWDIMAAGRGWPIPTVLYPWRTMQKYYRGLNVLLCTAICEGGPLPPLEALACGVPVVVPTGVGLMDELPEMAGIYHYPAGDYDAMVKAIKRALAEPGEQAELRHVVEPFSVKRWCAEFTRAVDAIYNPPDPEPEPEPQEERAPVYAEAQQRQRGLYVVAFGGPSRRCAVTAIKTFKAHMPDVPVALVSDRPLGPEDITIKRPDLDIGGRSLKTQIYDMAPPEWTDILYLDADTETVAPVPYLFDILDDGWDMAICVNPDRYHLARHMGRPDSQEETRVTLEQIGSDELIQYQGGVFVFRRNQRTAEFFRSWHEEWQIWGKRDQGALLRAMHKNPLRLWLLGNEWNLSDRYLPEERTAGIVHRQTMARRWEGIVNGRLDSAEAWSAVSKWEARQ